MGQPGKLILGLFCFLLVPSDGRAASLEALADKLARQTRDLADDSYRGFNDRDRGNRSDVEVLYLTHQVSAGAALLRRMVADGRPESELRDSVTLLTDLARASDRYTFARRQWRDIQSTLAELSRELGGTGLRRDTEDRGQRVTGRMRWRGRVDDEIHIHVQGADASVRLITGAPAGNASFTFTSALPERRVTLTLTKFKGRGPVEIIQEPARANNFTAIIQIRDNRSGQDDYEFEVVW